MFSDSDGNSISFFKRVKDGNANIGDDVDTQTEFNSGELIDVSVQVIDTECESTQTNVMENSAKENLKIDEKKLEIFLPMAYNVINDALNNREEENIDFYEETEVEEYSSTTIIRIPCIDNKAEKYTKVSDISWNSNGSILAVSYFIDRHSGPCSHLGNLRFYKFNNFLETKSFKEKIDIETNSCIKCIDSHPKNPVLFVCGGYTGEISIVNLSDDKIGEEMVQFTSKVDSYFHKDCVISVRWIKGEYEGNYVKYNYK